MNLIRHSAARDLRVDFFRGLALWWIYTDHIPGDVLGDYSLRNFATCDATEVFVLLAGYGAGLSYGMGLGRNGYISTAADVLKRAWTLYIAHIFLFVLFTAQVTYSATAMNRLNYLSGDSAGRAGRRSVPQHAGGGAAAIPAKLAEYPAAVRRAPGVFRRHDLDVALAAAAVRVLPRDLPAGPCHRP